jgi:hypothetical protein
VKGSGCHVGHLHLRLFCSAKLDMCPFVLLIIGALKCSQRRCIALMRRGCAMQIVWATPARPEWDQALEITSHTVHALSVQVRQDEYLLGLGYCAWLVQPSRRHPSGNA